MERSEDVGTIVVVKHPKRNLYAVLDGHHRYWAVRHKGIKEMNCAVILDFLGLLFLLTKEGVFQPPKEFTQYVRVPLKRLENYFVANAIHT